MRIPLIHWAPCDRAAPPAAGSGWNAHRRRRVYRRMLALLALVIVLAAGPLVAVAAPGGLDLAQRPDQGWRLVFGDEFNGDTLDTGRWRTAFPWGRDRRHLGELQRYIPEAFALDQGTLQIVAEPTGRQGYDYTSGLISSYPAFAQEYGFFEIRAKLPRGQGLWPAFWLLPADGSWPPEIDVFEALGHETETVHMTAHWWEDGALQERKTSFTGPDFADDFHTFAVEWTRNKLVWYVDGVKRFDVRGQSPSGPMYLLANLAVGGEWPGAPDASTPFPAVFAIDYIRAFAPAPAPLLSVPRQMETSMGDHRRAPWTQALRRRRRERWHGWSPRRG
jgi:beta-glucanase (GH16 family)